MSKKDPFSRQVAITLVTQAGGLVVGLGNAMVVARVLGPELKGQRDLALLLPAGMALLLGCGVPGSNVHFLGSSKRTLDELARASVALSGMITLVGVGLLAVGFASGLFARLFPGVAWTLLLMAFCGFPAGLLQSYLVGILHGQERIGLVNLLQLGQTIGLCALNLILVWYLDLSLFGALLAWVLALGVALVVTASILRREGTSLAPKLEGELASELLGFGLKAHLGNAVQFLNYRLDVFLVQAYLGSAAVGLYGIGVRLGELLWNLPSALGFVIFPRASRPDDRAETRRLTARSSLLAFLLCGAGAVALAGGGRWGIRLLFGEAFVPAYPALVGLLPGITLFCVTKVLCGHIAGEGFPGWTATVSCVGLVVTVILDVLWIPRFGIRGAAWATSVSYALMTVVAIGMFLRLPPIEPVLDGVGPGEAQPSGDEAQPSGDEQTTTEGSDVETGGNEASGADEGASGGQP